MEPQFYAIDRSTLGDHGFSGHTPEEALDALEKALGKGDFDAGVDDEIIIVQVIKSGRAKFHVIFN